MDKIFYPDDFSEEAFTGSDCSSWSNAQVLEALDRIVCMLSGRRDEPGNELAEKGYQIVRNELRRRMQANVENFVRLELEMFYPVDEDTGFVEQEEELPGKIDSVESAFVSLDVLADGNDDLVFVGIHPEDYMRTWNRMIDRQRRKVYYYEDENDEEHMRIEKVETRPK